jgi:superfamily II DNA helicase RecQ
MSGFPIYHGQLNDEEHKIAMRKWKIGKSQWIIGTLAMAQEIDVTSIRIIINRKISWLSTDQHGDKQDKVLSMIHFVQMLGQAGQDRKPSMHHLLYSAIPLVTIHPSKDHGGLQAMVDFVSCQTCYRRTVSLFLNGMDQTCLTMLQTELCDVCVSNVVRVHS